MPPRPRLLPGLLAALLAAPGANAHFALRSPASWRVQDSLGDPQKVGPCGDEGTAPTTGAVTAFSPGETITIVLDETVFHPGHYRVALAVHDRSELPAEPPVTPGASPCGSVPIMTPPVFPVLADGVLAHTEPFTGTQSIQVTLPSDVTCTRCTLQVLEFMTSHGQPCFYHHCADISIAPVGTECATDAECDDAEACTIDRCSDTQECVHQPMTLGDVSAGFLGVLSVPACSTEPVPAAIGNLFGKADALVVRAAATPARTRRLLNRAAKRLRRAAHRITGAPGRHLSTECAAALSDVLAGAQSHVQCLLGDD